MTRAPYCGIVQMITKTNTKSNIYEPNHCETSTQLIMRENHTCGYTYDPRTNVPYFPYIAYDDTNHDGIRVRTSWRQGNVIRSVTTDIPHTMVISILNVGDDAKDEKTVTVTTQQRDDRKQNGFVAKVSITLKRMTVDDEQVIVPVDVSSDLVYVE